MKYFDYFNVSELFVNCTKTEIEMCVKMNYLDSLLVLLSVLDAFRDYTQKPIKITSSFRDLVHNQVAGGSKTSQHLIGQAIDFRVIRCPFVTSKFLFREFLQKSALERFVGQVIFYNKREFIHIGLRTPSHDLTFYEYEQRNC